MRTIDADELIKAISIHFYTSPYFKHIIDVIDNAPTVEITEEQAIDKLHETGWMQRHDKEMTEQPTGDWGKWIISEIQCPNCLEFYDTDCFAKGELDRCPNCKTKMKGGEEE